MDASCCRESPPAIESTQTIVGSPKECNTLVSADPLNVDESATIMFLDDCSSVEDSNTCCPSVSDQGKSLLVEGEFTSAVEESLAESIPLAEEDHSVHNLFTGNSEVSINEDASAISSDSSNQSSLDTDDSENLDEFSDEVLDTTADPTVHSGDFRINTPKSIV